MLTNERNTEQLTKEIAKTREVVQALVDDLSRAHCIEKPSLSQAKLILNISPTKP
jgi:hypothetical protein